MINDKIFGISDALSSLTPGAEWVLYGDNYDGINWLDKKIFQPSKEEVTNEIIRLQLEYDALEYQRLRAIEYPDFREYLDGIVKGDEEQVQAYIDACLAVKEKYPKPSDKPSV